MSTTIDSITSSSTLTSLVSNEASSSDDTTEETTSASSTTTTDISSLISAMEDSVSIIAKIVGSASEEESESDDATYNVLLSAQSAEIMKSSPSFITEVLAANQSDDSDVEGINLITIDTDTFMSLLANSGSSVSSEAEAMLADETVSA